MPSLIISDWDRKEIDLHWDDLSDNLNLVVCTPRLGEDLVVWAKGQLPINLGEIIQVTLEEGLGRGFLVRTNRFGERGGLLVLLANGVRATAGPMKGMRV